MAQPRPSGRGTSYLSLAQSFEQAAASSTGSFVTNLFAVVLECTVPRHTNGVGTQFYQLGSLF